MIEDYQKLPKGTSHDTVLKACGFQAIENILRANDETESSHELIKMVRDEVEMVRCQLDDKSPEVSQPTQPTAETHVFVGMFRPPWEDHLNKEMMHYDSVMKQFDIPVNSWHIPYAERDSYQQSVRSRWLRGDYDTPIYRTIEEVIKLRGTP